MNFYFSHFSEKFSAKIWLANPGEYFGKSLARPQKSLAIGDRASANEYTARVVPSLVRNRSNGSSMKRLHTGPR